MKIENPADASKMANQQIFHELFAKFVTSSSIVTFVATETVEGYMLKLLMDRIIWEHLKKHTTRDMGSDHRPLK